MLASLSAEGPNGTMTRTFAFKVEGAKLTGETINLTAKTPQGEIA